jgi:hypothetical protein
LALVLTGFGMNVFAHNVQNINAIQRKAGLWLRDFAAPDARVAADEIGAIRYFSNRYVIDLVGLVTPEIVPLKRARQPLAPFLCMNKADYIVIYPGTHDDLFVLDMELVWLERVEMNTINPGPTLHIYRVLGCSRVR